MFRIKTVKYETGATGWWTFTTASTIQQGHWWFCCQSSYETLNGEKWNIIQCGLVNIWSQISLIKGQMRLWTLDPSFKSTDLISQLYKKRKKEKKKPKNAHMAHLEFCGHTVKAAAKQNELFLLLEGLSKQLWSIQCWYNKQCIIYSRHKHSQPWMKVSASETQNGTNCAGALTAVGKKFLSGLCNYFLGLLTRSSFKLSEK